ncbi:MAG TPA: hypothetical protein VGH50_12685 [Candidatus Binatia bacterium]|jgi:hypothetical protein
MNNLQYYRRWLFTLTATIFFVTIVLAQEKGTSDYGWLNGKWEGTPPQGGKVQMDMRVTNGNQVKGTGFIVQTGIRSKNTRQVEGIVDRDKVELTYFGVNETIKYDLKFVDDKLVGTGTNPGLPKPVETIFVKLK